MMLSYWSVVGMIGIHVLLMELGAFLVYTRRVECVLEPHIPRHSLRAWSAAIPLATVNLLCFGVPISLYCIRYFAEHIYDVEKRQSQPWSVAVCTTAVHASVLPIFLELWFFATHRMLHVVPWLYRHIHKIHHRFRHPTPVCALYAHPVEFVGGNLAGIVGAPLLCGALFASMSPWLYVLWIYGSFAMSLASHSGIAMLGAASHDTHHRSFNRHYGVLGICDALWCARDVRQSANE
jgi:sterol desaturase/sphingolipid hydroxylase (fatty acid hydroxylase superfamily)